MVIKDALLKRQKIVKKNTSSYFICRGHQNFGIDRPEDYGTLSYYDDAGVFHEEKVISEVGDYGNVFDGLYESIIEGKEPRVKDEQTLLQMEILETGVKIV